MGDDRPTEVANGRNESMDGFIVAQQHSHSFFLFFNLDLLTNFGAEHVNM